MKKNYLKEMNEAWGDNKKVGDLQVEGLNEAASMIMDAVRSTKSVDMPFVIAAMEIILNSFKNAKPEDAKMAKRFLENTTAVFTMIDIKKEPEYEIKEISREEAGKLVCSAKPGELKRVEFTPYGLFYVVEDGDYVGYDNSTGDCWVECFGTKEKCIAWLKGEFEIDD